MEDKPAGTTKSGRHIRALTGIRFFAALHVVLFHTSGWATWKTGPLRDLVGNGYVAVSLFFVLSGFILAYTYGPRGIDRRDFYVARFARIYPVYAFGLLLAAPFFVRDQLRTHALASLAGKAVAVTALLQAYIPSWTLAWNPPAWSLSVEALFYAVFPWIAPPLLRMPRAKARAVATAAWVASMILVGVYVAIAEAPATYASEGTWLDVIRYGPVARLPEFVVGIVLGRELLAGARLPRAAAPLSLVGVLVVLAAVPGMPYLFIHNGALVPLFAVLILALATRDGPVARLLGSAPLVLLGEASYALYILHVPLFMLSRSLVKARAPELLDTGPFCAVYTFVAVAASVATFRLLEVPMRKRVRAAFATL